MDSYGIIIAGHYVHNGKRVGEKSPRNHKSKGGRGIIFLEFFHYHKGINMVIFAKCTVFKRDFQLRDS